MRSRSPVRAHLAICRLNHWFKNVFVIPGIIAAMAIDRMSLSILLVSKIMIGLLATGFVTSSNYVLNELLDAPYDRYHPEKWRRSVPSGEVNIVIAYIQWVGLAVVGIGIGLGVSRNLGIVLAGLWIMGVLYNVQPIRTKDIVYLDVLSEAINNPLRMLIGWFTIEPRAMVPSSLLISYWMAGGYFMAMKRFAELRNIGDRTRAIWYRCTFRYYNDTNLLVSIMFYASASMLFFGAFIMRYRLNLILSFPFVALVMAIYLKLGLEDNSSTQRPESLYQEKALVASIVICAIVMAICLFSDFPSLTLIRVYS